MECCAQGEVGLWGHEYVRSLSGEIGEEYHARREAEEPVEDLLELVSQIVPYHMSHNAGATHFLMGTLACPHHVQHMQACTTPHQQHHIMHLGLTFHQGKSCNVAQHLSPADQPSAAGGGSKLHECLSCTACLWGLSWERVHDTAEPEAVDLLLEVERLEWLVPHVDAKNYARCAAEPCLWLISMQRLQRSSCCSAAGQTGVFTLESNPSEARGSSVMRPDHAAEQLLV